MEFSQWLQHEMDKRDLTKYRLAKFSGVHQTTIANLLAGTKPQIETERKIRDAILKMDEEKEKSPAEIGRGKIIPSNLMPVPNFVKKPRLGTIACGKPILAVEDAEEFDFVPDNIDCDFTLRCKGDSMINARIFDGDIVYIRKQPEVENGEIAAVRIGDEATLKRVYYSGDRLILRAANPLYSDMEFDGADLENVEIMGKAVAFTSLVR